MQVVFLTATTIIALHLEVIIGTFQKFANFIAVLTIYFPKKTMHLTCTPHVTVPGIRPHRKKLFPSSLLLIVPVLYHLMFYKTQSSVLVPNPNQSEYKDVGCANTTKLTCILL